MMHRSMQWLGASLALAACLPAQDDMIAKRDKKLASEFFKKADWLTDFDSAKAEAREEDRLIFAYMTRSFATWPPCLALEGSELLEERFAEFGEEVVLYCHITSHVDGDEYPDLLGQKGGSGWPYLAVMNASGDVLAKHSMDGDINSSNFRTTDGFRITLDQAAETAERIEALDDLASEGDQDSALELLELRVDLAHIDMASAKQQLTALTNVSAKKQKVLGQKIIENEVNAIMTTASMDPKTQQAAGKKFAVMLEQKRIPRGNGSMYFWYFLAVHAKADKKLDLLEQAIAGLKKDGKLPADVVAGLEKSLAELRQKP